MKRGYLVEIGMTVKNMVYIIVLGVFYLFLIQEGDQFSRATIMLTGALYGMLSYLMRIGWKAVVKKRSSGEHSGRSLLIITTEKQSQSVVKSMLDFDYIGVRPTGVVLVDQDRTGHKIHGVPVVSNLADAAEYVCREWFDEVLIVLPEGKRNPAESIRRIRRDGHYDPRKNCGRERNAGKKSDCRAHGQLYRGHHLHQYGKRRTACAETNHGHLRRSCRMYSDRNHLPVRCPCDLYQSLRDPIFFSQYRVGKNGRKFKIYKFRSMYMDAEERKKELMKQNRVSDGLMFKMENDPRVIGSEKGPGKGIGNFIRKTSLDEFPQFFNVLKGDMSLVGTRPPTVDEWEKYELHHRARLAIKPGLTGMWQVSGRSEITDFEEVVKLDTKYISEWSFMLDIKILFKTVLIVLGQKGSM